MKSKKILILLTMLQCITHYYLFSEGNFTIKDIEPTREWHTFSIFHGLILQAPYIINPDEVIIFTDNSVIQRYNFQTGTKWNYPFLRVPQPNWHIQNDDFILINSNNSIYTFSSRGYIAHNNINLPMHKSYRIIDGKFVSIHENGTIEIFSDFIPNTDSSFISWKFPQPNIRMLNITPQGEVIIQSDESISWYTVEGDLLNTFQISANGTELTYINDEFIVHSKETNSFYLFTKDGRLKYQDSATITGNLKLSISSKNDTPNIHIFHRLGSLLIQGPEEKIFEFFRIQDPWELQHFSYKNGFLYVTDTLWRLHRFDIQRIVQAFFQMDIELVDIESEAQGSLPSQESLAIQGLPKIQGSPPSLLTTLLVDLIDSPDIFRRELELIIENFQQSSKSRGEIEQSLMQIADYIYTSRGRYRIVDPRLRSILLNFLLVHAGTESSLEILEFLHKEDNPIVYANLIPLIKSKTTLVQIEAIRKILNYFQLNRGWQNDFEFIERCINFFIHIHNTIESENSYVESLLEQGFNFLYNNIYEKDIRQRIFQYTS